VQETTRPHAQVFCGRRGMAAAVSRGILKNSGPGYEMVGVKPPLGRPQRGDGLHGPSPPASPPAPRIAAYYPEPGANADLGGAARSLHGLSQVIDRHMADIDLRDTVKRRHGLGQVTDRQLCRWWCVRTPTAGKSLLNTSPFWVPLNHH
jgi:hypothetical protein